MSNFSIKYAVSATPIEELIADDSNNKSKIIHSNIDRSFGGGLTLSCGTAASNIKHAVYTTLAGGVGTILSHADIFNGSLVIDFLLVRIIEPDNVNDWPKATITYDGSVVVSSLNGNGDVVLLRPSNKLLEDIAISSVATYETKVDILVGKQP